MPFAIKEPGTALCLRNPAGRLQDEQLPLGQNSPEN